MIRLIDDYDIIQEDRKLKKSMRKKINYDDDFVIIYDEKGREIYRDLEDYEPMKYENWIWDETDKCYYLEFEDEDGKKHKYMKVCVDTDY